MIIRFNALGGEGRERHRKILDEDGLVWEQISYDKGATWRKKEQPAQRPNGLRLVSKACAH